MDVNLLPNYISGLKSSFKDSRVRKNIDRLCSTIVANRHINLYTMSEDKRTYDVFRGLLNGEQVLTLDSDIILSCVQKQAETLLGTESKPRYVLHDGCDIRKVNSKEMEYLGDVLSLSKKVITGYKTMNSIVVDMEKQSVKLLCHELYSNKMPNYIGEGTLSDETLMAGLNTEQQKLVENGTYINTKVLLLKSLKKSSELIKGLNAQNKVCHIIDREHDDESVFDKITSELKDEFVIRLKSNRLSHKTCVKYTPTGKVSKRTSQCKLVDKKFDNGDSFCIEKIRIKGVTYRNVTAYFDWEDLKLGEKDYNVVRITLKKEGKALFQQPMLLITNRTLNNAQDAKAIYLAYLLRSKIEVVFRFLKQNLGWEAFQIRDFNSIKNLLALAFFLVGFFPELEKELAAHPIAMQLCQLAKSKGIVSLHFMLKGLEALAHFQEVTKWINQNDISPDQIQELLQMINIVNTKQ